jgi:DNA-binding transcriptional LysR family regulator
MHMAWDDLRVFLAVAETGSLSAAAKRLGVTQPTVSRRIADLESSVGEALFVRSAEGAAVTSFGESLLEPSRRMAEWAAEVERAAARAETSPQGTVRITAPPGVAFDFVAPFAAWAREKLPDVRLEVLSSIQYLDLSRREADLALRFAAPAQRDVITIASVEIAVGAFASEAYAKTLPRKCRLRDVAWIVWAPPFENVTPNPELAAAIPDFRPVFASDDFLVQIRAAEAGLGAIFLGRVGHRFSSWRLVPLELDLRLPPRPLHLACARSALEIPRVRAVSELLIAELRKARIG